VKNGQLFCLSYGNSPNNNTVNTVRTFLNVFESKVSNSSDNNVLFPLSFHDISGIIQLKPKMWESLFSSLPVNPLSPTTLMYLPALSSSLLLASRTNPVLRNQLFSHLSYYSECLFGDIMNIDSVMGYSLSSHSISENVLLLQTILELGLQYSCSESEKLLMLFPVFSAKIHLTSFYNEKGEKKLWKEIMWNILPNSFQKRVKDMKRIFKTKLGITSSSSSSSSSSATPASSSTVTSSNKLTFSINTNFSYCVQKLREYHGDDCWIGETLEKVWYEMMNKKEGEKETPTFLIFELWFNNDLIAADFGHLLHGGKYIYIATRFTNRSSSELYKTIPSGFLLAILACQYLYENGCVLWDLGGVNYCPLMRYKYDLTGNEPEERPLAFHWFHTNLKKPVESEPLRVFPTGILIENVTIDNIL
jgi:hypothetical protein